ncbi:MAG: hypothetical protein HZA60_08630 [Deltaproteobacteria bacterium]|nr:hypothetical protein [Deltaproteobacteria bacterium]
MKRLRNENGAALLFVLLLSVVALITSAGLLYVVARGGFLSGQQKRYATALAAGRAGAEVTFQLVADRGDDTIHFADNTLINKFIGPNLQTKLGNPTNLWGAGADSSSTISPDNNTTYDLRFDLGNYRVHAKIVDTVAGNSGADLGLIKGGVVTTVPGEVTVMNIPYLYTIEELSEDRTNPQERSKISILYQY